MVQEAEYVTWFTIYITWVDGGYKMDFYRVIKKDADCDVILAVFISMVEAHEYCASKIRQYPDDSYYVDTIKSGIKLSKSFMGKEYDTI